MKTLKLEGAFSKTVLIDITHQDSNEEPEEECINRLVSIKMGEKIYNYFNQDVDSALSGFETTLQSMNKLGPLDIPDVVFCLAIRFKSNFYIDWAAIERNFHARQKILVQGN